MVKDQSDNSAVVMSAACSRAHNTSVDSALCLSRAGMILSAREAGPAIGCSFLPNTPPVASSCSPARCRATCPCICVGRSLGLGMNRDIAEDFAGYGEPKPGRGRKGVYPNLQHGLCCHFSHEKSLKNWS